MSTVAVAIMCKTPISGLSKTRLSPPLRPDECAALSACFIRDLSATFAALAADGDVAPYAVYTPRGSEADLQRLLPESFTLWPQSDGDFGARLQTATADLLQAGHAGAILVNSDSPTLPKALLRRAVDAVRSGDNVTLSPALDGGYTLIGLSRLHAALFHDIPWSTSEVYSRTVARAHDIGLPVANVPPWYDVDDAASFSMLEAEFSGVPLPFADGMRGSKAAATRQFLRLRREAAIPV